MIIYQRNKIRRGGEMADAQVSEACGFIRGGSSPLPCTKRSDTFMVLLCFLQFNNFVY